jgi:hypothetical protein
VKTAKDIQYASASHPEMVKAELLEADIIITATGFNLQRGRHLMPKRGDHEPWLFSADYYTEKDQLPRLDLDEDALVYELAATRGAAVA